MTKILEVKEMDYVITIDGLYNNSYHGKWIVMKPKNDTDIGTLGYCSTDGGEFTPTSYTADTFREIINQLKGLEEKDPVEIIEQEFTKGVELTSIVDTLSQHTKASALQKFSFDELKQLKEMGLL